MPFVMSFDQYQRYKMIELILNELRSEGEILNIIDVGAGVDNRLQQLLPIDNITYLDQLFSTEHVPGNKFIKADAKDIPFNDNHFDYAVTLDTLEHIDEKSRLAFIDELTRVSRNGFIIAAPFYDEFVISAESQANKYCEALYGEKYPWLEEHVKFKLPDYNSIYDYILSKTDNLYTFQHGSIYIWEKLIKVHISAILNTELTVSREEVDYYYNENLFTVDFNKPCYRTYFVSISREKVSSFKNMVKYFDRMQSNRYSSKELLSLKNVIEKYYRDLLVKINYTINEKHKQLEQKNQEINHSNHLIEQKNQEIVGLVEKMEHFENQLISKNQENKQKTMELDLLDKKLFSKSQECKQKEKQISELSKALKQKDNQLIELMRDLKDNNEEMQDLLTSKSWRVTAPLRRITGWFK